MSTPQAQKVLEPVRKECVVRGREVTERGVHPEYLRRLCQEEAERGRFPRG